MWICVCGDVNAHIWLWKYAYLIMLGYGHDESVPYAWRGVRTPFRWCTQRYRKPFAALSQSVSSRRGPIYRARIYVFATTLKTI